MQNIELWQTSNLNINVLEPNKGQIKGVAKNPRLIKTDKYNKLKKSLIDNPEMMGARELIVYPHGSKYVVIGGNMRYAVLKELGYKQVPCKLAPESLSAEQIRAVVIKDNVSYGDLDFEILANEWDTDEITDWGIDVLSFNNFFEEVENSDIQPTLDPTSGSSASTDPEQTQQIQKETVKLSDKFIIPPFSVFDTKQGYWQNRKTMWKNYGIKSEEGRQGNLIGYSQTILTSGNPKKALDDIIKKSSPLANNTEAIIPSFYSQKAAGLSEYEIIKKFLEESDLGGTSIFDPVLCEISYRWFCTENGKVLDPFAGGSVRAIVATKLGYTYTGVDLRQEQVDANIVQLNEICGQDHGAKYHVGSSENVKEMVSGKFDMIFTCPPYYDLEQYSEDPNDLSAMSYQEFDAAYENIIKQCVDLLADNSFSVFVVGDVRDSNGVYLDLIGKTVKAHQDAGAVLYNSAILLETVGSAAMRASRIFNGGRKLTKIHQNVLVFYKGNIAAIKDKFQIVVSEEDLYEPELQPEATEGAEQTESTMYGEKITLSVDI